MSEFKEWLVNLSLFKFILCVGSFTVTFGVILSIIGAIGLKGYLHRLDTDVIDWVKNDSGVL